MKSYKLYVNNEWVGGADTREIVNPANGQPLAVVAEADRQDVERAIAVARATFDNTDWRESSKARSAGASCSRWPNWSANTWPNSPSWKR